MELPQALKNLYRHWKKHTSQTLKKSDFEVPEELTWFMTERMKIWEKKFNGENPPFTTDKILQKYRFCNIYRELDNQTIEIHKRLNNLRDNFPLWLLNVAFQRFVCKPETVGTVGQLNFEHNNNKSVCKNLCDIPKPKYGTPYVFPVNVIQKSEFPTREEFFCFYLPHKIRAVAKTIQSFNNTTVNKALDKVLPEFGFNFRFHWTEILIDVAYQFPNLIDLYEDFYVGPGATPTTKLLKPNSSPTETVDMCVGMQLNSFPHLTFDNKPVLLSAENWEGIFCEYRKYRNLKSGHGRVRRFSK